MAEPWLERESDERTDSTIYTFIIFCEDEVCEPDYFESFKTEDVSIVTHRGQGGKRLTVERAIAGCLKNGLLKYSGKELTPMFGDGVQVWCVFDRDINNESTDEILDATRFNTAISMADSHFLKVAWSNDAFELWVLLHILDIRGNEANFMHRQNYYDSLVAYLKDLKDPHEQLQKKLSHASFTYDDVKNRRVFIPGILPILKDKTEMAIQRAEQLEATYADKPCHEMVPYTRVHHLIKEINKAISGAKKIREEKPWA